MFEQKKNLNVLFLIFAFLIIFGIGFFVGKGQVVCRVCPPEQVDFSLFWETWNKLSQQYVDSSKVDTQKMIYGAISGMVSSVGDPYTTFFPPPAAKQFLDDVTGKFEGIGVEVGIKNGQLQVVSPLEGTPGQKAGLRAGDVIVKIGDKLTSDMTVEDAVNQIKGPKGTEVKLTIARAGWDSPKEFSIKRDLINVPSLKWDLISKNNSSEKNVAYIRIFQFSENAGTDFANAANEILKSPAKEIVLDLRDNPGGYLEVAQDIAGWFLERGQIVTSEDFNGKRTNVVSKTEGNSKLLKYPLVVLINQGSASASEILSAALRDNRGAKLVGVTSFGKGSVQELENLSGKSSIKITVAHWLTPKGNQINGVGLTPDVKSEMTEDDYKNGKDPQLEKALEILN